MNTPPRVAGAKPFFYKITKVSNSAKWRTVNSAMTSEGNAQTIPTNPFLPVFQHQFNHKTVPYFSMQLKRSITTILFCCCFLMGSKIRGKVTVPGVGACCALPKTFFIENQDGVRTLTYQCQAWGEGGWVQMLTMYVRRVTNRSIKIFLAKV